MKPMKKDLKLKVIKKYIKCRKLSGVNKNFVQRGQSLVKKRKDQRRERKFACVEEFVEPAGTIVQRNIGVDDNRRVFDIKCPECSFVATKLLQHLASIHKYTDSEAKLKESEVRVMYLWANKDKHDVPLPCQLCCNCHIRLDNHLKRIHKLDKNEVQSMLKAGRGKHWSASISTY